MASAGASGATSCGQRPRFGPRPASAPRWQARCPGWRGASGRGPCASKPSRTAPVRLVIHDTRGGSAGAPLHRGDDIGSSRCGVERYRGSPCESPPCSTTPVVQSTSAPQQPCRQRPSTPVHDAALLVRDMGRVGIASVETTARDRCSRHHAPSRCVVSGSTPLYPPARSWRNGASGTASAPSGATSRSAVTARRRNAVRRRRGRAALPSRPQDTSAHRVRRSSRPRSPCRCPGTGPPEGPDDRRLFVLRDLARGQVELQPVAVRGNVAYRSP